MCLSTNDYFEYENVGFTPVFTNVVAVQLIFVSSSLRPHQPITVIPFRFPKILCTDSHTTIKKRPCRQHLELQGLYFDYIRLTDCAFNGS